MEEGDTPGERPAASSGIKPRILVIDDDVHFLKLLVGVLDRAGLDVTKAGNGKEAFECLERVQFDIVLSDFDLPDTTGLVICDKLKQDPMYQRIPFLLMSGRPLEEIQHLALASCAEDCIAKPFAPNRLIAKIFTHVAKR